MKCYDKHGFIIRFETVINNAVEFVASKSLSNLRYLVQVGQNATRRLQPYSVDVCMLSSKCPRP